MKTLKQFSPQIEIYSIDEAFLNLTSIKDMKIYWSMVIKLEILF